MNAEVCGFLDTNVLVYAFDASAPVGKRSVAQGLIAEAIERDRWCCSAQVLSEFFVTVTRKGAVPMPIDQAVTLVEHFRPLARIGLDHALVMRGIDVHRRFQIPYWDGMIIAAAERAGCSEVLSEDLGGGQNYFGVTVRNPFA